MGRRLLFPALCLSLLAAPAALAHGGHLEVDEQWFIYDLNQARWDPAGYAADNGVALNEKVLPRPPLAVNLELIHSASLKAEEMEGQGRIYHQSPLPPYDWPNELLLDAGYNHPWEPNANYVESNFAGGAASAASFMGSGVHRDHLFGQTNFWGSHREIGAGESGNYWSIHTGHISASDKFITGVVYDDANNNKEMDLGEGLSGVTVTAGGKSTTTNVGGGYSIKVGNGRYTVTASGPGFAGTAKAKKVRVKGYNVGVDFVSGNGKGIVRDYQKCRGQQPTILGTSGNDTIVGTSGKDVIHGLAGNDTIKGLGGNDVICGGSGNDHIEGGSGQDKLVGQSGADDIFGGSGADKLIGGGGTDYGHGGSGSDTCKGIETKVSC